MRSISRAANASPTATFLPPALRMPLTLLPLRVLDGCDRAMLYFLLKDESLIHQPLAATFDTYDSSQWNVPCEILL